MLDRLFTYFSAYPTVRYASIVILLISVCAALLGVCLVLKRYSMIGDGLSHVSFGATAIATVLGLTTPIYVTLPLTVISAIVILKLRTSAKTKGDSAIAMISAGALALGYLLLNLFGSDSANANTDACATLFGGGIMSISLSDVILCAILATIVLVLFLFCFHKIYAVTFDEDFAAATGIKAGLYDTLIAVTVGITVVLAMNMLGALLASALVIFPALSAMRLFKSFKSVAICAVIISIICAAVGITVSLLLATATGPTTVVANLAVFAVSFIVGKIKKA